MANDPIKTIRIPDFPPELGRPVTDSPQNTIPLMIRTKAKNNQAPNLNFSMFRGIPYISQHNAAISGLKQWVKMCSEAKRNPLF